MCYVDNLCLLRIMRAEEVNQLKLVSTFPHKYKENISGVGWWALTPDTVKTEMWAGGP